MVRWRLVLAEESQMVQWLTSLAALVAAVAALIFQFDPGLIPDPNVQESAKVTVTTVDRNVVDPAAGRRGRGCARRSVVRAVASQALLQAPSARRRWEPSFT
jgi:hypothetical protein